ncbi:Hypothetical predicted protein [Paramuricea clavata]|uniref:Uncharacterized protein n=1 Tax=Paramuricea clavata TaxID=317549 RepID=A0A6S7IYK1_PARCT|nr:Hypothetical predicted protein [Paramuricea clavata]
MHLKSYTGIIISVTLMPALVVFIVGCIIWFYYRKCEGFMLQVFMENIISKKNINKRPTYLVCNRKLSSLNRHYFTVTSILVISICVQCFFLLAIVDVSYECLHDPGLDCFKKKDDVKISDTLAYDESPVNCSTISGDDTIICYRLTAFDPKRIFIAAAAAYLLSKMLNFCLLTIAHIMLWAATKWKATTLLCIEIIFSLIFIIVMIIPLVLRTCLDEIESAFPKLSYTVFVQVVLVVLVILYFVIRLPWEEFGESEEYYEDASLPSEHVREDEDEMV